VDDAAQAKINAAQAMDDAAQTMSDAAARKVIAPGRRDRGQAGINLPTFPFLPGDCRPFSENNRIVKDCEPILLTKTSINHNIYNCRMK
jgi:hypothetical protein